MYCVGFTIMVCFIATICLSRPNTHHRIACLGVLRYNSGKGGNSVEDCKGQSVRLFLFHFHSLFTIILNTNIKRVEHMGHYYL